MTLEGLRTGPGATPEGKRLVHEHQLAPGRLAAGRVGIVVTSSGFTKAAVKTAQGAGLKTIWLVDGNELCRLVLDNFESLDDDLKDELKLKRVFRVE